MSMFLRALPLQTPQRSGLLLPEAATCAITIPRFHNEPCYLCNNNSQIPQRTLRNIMMIIEARSDEVIQKWISFFGSATFYC